MSQQEERGMLLPKLAMLYVTIMLVKSILSYKLVTIHGFTTMGGAITIPLWFVFSDVIAEVYGYRIARQFILWSFVCQLLFSLIGFAIINLPSPEYWHEQHSYDLVIGSMLRVTVSDCVAYIVGGFLNIYILIRWKMLLRGRYFILRSMGSSVVSEFVYTLLAVFFIQYGKLSLNQIVGIIFVSFSTKVVCSMLLPFLANIVVHKIRKWENIPVFVYDLNPFRAER